MNKFFFIFLYLLLAFPIASNGNVLTTEPILTIDILSVGYADATVIRLPDKRTLMIDTAPAEQANTILEFLKQKNIRAIDFLVLTHEHDNHTGGLSILSQEIPIRKIFTAKIDFTDPLLNQTIGTLESKGTRIETLKRGDNITLNEKLKLRVLHPESLSGSPNVDSIVIEIIYDEMKFLFCGDITPDIQEELMNRSLLTASPNLILLPHHGGEVSSGFATFIEAATKVISTGAHKEWVSPHPKTLKRFSRGLYRTDQLGHLSFQSDGKHISGPLRDERDISKP